eukprot:GHVS01041834.1.p1 GENE.GHVS01041834.1~~GHVS01041834.1.p1  ORF type:complete len:475 (+),score=135.51 GHVS01041834.1:369-1793(+)
MNRLNVVLQHLQTTPYTSSTANQLTPSSSLTTTNSNNSNNNNSNNHSSFTTTLLSSSSSPSFIPRSPPPLSACASSSSSRLDVFICAAVRTPLTRSGKGLLRHLQAEELLQPLFQAVVKQCKLPAAAVEDVCIGNVLQPGAGVFSSRIAAILSGIPTSTPVYTVNRLCSSGLQAVANIAAAIQSGHIELGVAGGVESMSQYDMMDMMNPDKLSEAVFDNVQARNCLLPMGVTSENVAAKFGISRHQQDELAMESQQKASRAAQTGKFREEIVPVKVRLPKEGGGGGGEVVWVTADDGIRPSTTMAGLAKLKPAFQKNTGTTTAGNSSQTTDGAAMVLLANGNKVNQLELRALARFVAFVVVGVPPDIMGIGPAVAIPKVLQQAGLSMSDIDVFEINEAFASQATYCVAQLKVPKHKLNPNGGAIALGHPLGCTGSRLVATLLPELRRRKGRYGVVSMCIGTGMGAAAVIENMVL